MILKDQLRLARELRHFTQDTLAQECGLKTSQISAFETGRRSPSVQNLVKLADALGVSADYLLGREVLDAQIPPNLQAILSLARTLTKRELELLLKITACLSGWDE